MSTQERIEKMLKLSEHIIAAGGEKKVAKQHASGKLTARERIALLLDEGSFVELDRFVSHRCTNFGQDKKELPGEGVTTGYGTVDGRLVYSLRTSPLKAAPSAKCMLTKSLKYSALLSKWVLRALA